MKCLKCQWSPLHPMRPRRHHAKCPLRASVEWRVREIRAWSLRESFFCERERRERNRAYRRAVECECAELIAGARALLAEGADPSATTKAP